MNFAKIYIHTYDYVRVRDIRRYLQIKSLNPMQTMGEREKETIFEHTTMVL